MCAECVEYARQANEELDAKYEPREEQEPEDDDPPLTPEKPEP